LTFRGFVVILLTLIGEYIMKEYYIYHIPGVKIGCTDRLEDRLDEQGYSISDCEILETHTDIYVVSDRELELQKEYGYSVDATPYYVSKQRWINGCRIGGKIAGRKNVKSGHLASIRDKAKEIKRIPVSAYHKDTGEFIGEYVSQIEAARQLGLFQAGISAVLSGRARYAGDYTFKREPK